MTQQFIQPGIPALADEFDRLVDLFPEEPGSEEDLSLCFLCLRWTTGDEGCRRGYRCELQSGC